MAVTHGGRECTAGLRGTGQAGLVGFCGQSFSCFLLLMIGGSSREVIDSHEYGFNFLIETDVN